MLIAMPSLISYDSKTPKVSLKRYSVVPIPTHPTTRPIGIAIADKNTASYNTVPIICFFVAPIDLSNPNCLVLSLTDIENEL